jgi:hypothetical protein
MEDPTMRTPIRTAVAVVAHPVSRRRAGRLRRLAAFAAVLAAGAAHAGDFSLGAGIAASHGKGRCVDSFSCDRSSGGGKLFGAWRVDDALDVQAVYFGGHRFEGGDTTPLGTEFGGRFEVDGFGLSVGYRWTFAPAWSLTGRAGIAGVRTRFDYADEGLSTASKTTAQPLAGLRLGWQASPQTLLGLDYDVTAFKVHTTRGRLQMLGVSAQFTF